MKQEQSANIGIFATLSIFFIINTGFYHLIQRPIIASDWGKVNLVSCMRLINKEVVCKRKYSDIFGLFSENTEFKLQEANIRKYEGSTDTPDEYTLSLKTNDGVIEIPDYGDDHERIYQHQILLREMLRGSRVSTVNIKYGDGFIKVSLIYFLGFLSFILSIILILVLIPDTSQQQANENT